MAAEIQKGHGRRQFSDTRFNEAAANGRGNRVVHVVQRPEVRGASMRPRRMAAEITSRPFSGSPPSTGFNEAAANGRGNRPDPFQEDPNG